MVYITWHCGSSIISLSSKSGCLAPCLSPLARWNIYQARALITFPSVSAPLYCPCYRAAAVESTLSCMYSPDNPWRSLGLRFRRSRRVTNCLKRARNDVDIPSALYCWWVSSPCYKSLVKLQNTIKLALRRINQKLLMLYRLPIHPTCSYTPSLHPHSVKALYISSTNTPTAHGWATWLEKHSSSARFTRAKTFSSARLSHFTYQHRDSLVVKDKSTRYRQQNAREWSKNETWKKCERHTRNGNNWVEGIIIRDSVGDHWQIMQYSLSLVCFTISRFILFFTKKNSTTINTLSCCASVNYPIARRIHGVFAEGG